MIESCRAVAAAVQQESTVKTVSQPDSQSVRQSVRLSIALPKETLHDPYLELIISACCGEVRALIDGLAALALPLLLAWQPLLKRQFFRSSFWGGELLLASISSNGAIGLSQGCRLERRDA